jgi:carbon monoxide dehydrogenase subunit G
MAYYASTGTLDAPIEKVWRLIDDHTPENVPKIHPGFVSFRVLERKGNVEVREATSLGPDGKPLTYRVRFTVDRPRSQGIDWLTGPLAGSWVLHTYIPDGAATRVHVAGDVHVAGMDDKAALNLVAGFLDQAFEEDAAWLKRMK